ncbi:MAG: zinc-ribbon domain-containing protein [Geobacteraceae bacterium]
MIIQCDQCNTKFKLDDAKVPDKGVKVRCAKCKHIFKVQREVASEETDFDFLLTNKSRAKYNSSVLGQILFLCTVRMTAASHRSLGSLPL